MKIFTTYFGYLRKLPNSIIPISVATKPIPGWTGYSYNPLAPGWNIWKIGKNLGWEIFKETYNKEILGKLNPYEVLKDLSELSGGNDIALVCYEKPGDNCHRHLIADWLPCEVIEYNLQNLISV